MSAIYTSAEITGLDGSSVFVEESLDNEFYQYPTLKRYIVSIKREGRQIATVQLTAWWGTDVVLSWWVASRPTWMRWERASAHLFVFLVFSTTTLALRPTPITKVLGSILSISVAVAFVIWLIVRDLPPGGDLPETR